MQIEHETIKMQQLNKQAHAAFQGSTTKTKR
jgi:hypothetical protein